MLHSSVFRTGLALAALTCAGLAQAVPLNVGYDNFTYSGTVTRYATLADAQNQANATGGPYTIQTVTNNSPLPARATRSNARDGNLSVTSAAPAAYGSDVTYLSTAWYFTTFPANGDGWGNPNNSNNGFIQYYLTSSAPTVNGGWQPGYTQFRLTVSGGNGDSSNAARFWPVPNPDGPANISGGTYVEFNLNLTANFASPATLNGATGWYETTAMPSSVTGTVSGIFQNDQANDTQYNGFYRFSYTLAGPGSWAADNAATWDDGGTRVAPASLWAAPAAVVPTSVAPVPSLGTWALLGLSLALGLMAAMRQGARARPARLR